MKRRIKVDFTKPLKVDLGCGSKKRAGYIGIDHYDFGQDIVWDLTQGIPLPDNSVDEMYASHFLEHVAPQYLDDLFLEIYRVLKPKSTFEAHVPHRSQPDAWYWMHRSYWDEQTLVGYINNWWSKEERKHTNTEVSWEIVRNDMVGGNPPELQFVIRKRDINA